MAILYTLMSWNFRWGKVSLQKKWSVFITFKKRLLLNTWKCPIKVELVKKSSHRAGTLQMPFQIHSDRCGMFALSVKQLVSQSLKIVWRVIFLARLRMAQLYPACIFSICSLQVIGLNYYVIFCSISELLSKYSG